MVDFERTHYRLNDITCDPAEERLEDIQNSTIFKILKNDIELKNKKFFELIKRKKWSATLENSEILHDFHCFKHRNN